MTLFRRWLGVFLCVLLAVIGMPAYAGARGMPRVVIAHIDSGINPYHEVFRDRSPLAYVHPSK